MGRTWSETSLADEKVGAAEEERCERRERAAREAMAGAPLIFIVLIASNASSGVETRSQVTV